MDNSGTAWGGGRIADRGDHQAGDDRDPDGDAHQDLLMLGVCPPAEARAQPPPQRQTSCCIAVRISGALDLLARHDRFARAIGNLGMREVPLARRTSQGRYQK